MPLDRRLREGIDRFASDLEPDVDRILQRSVRGARRTIVLRRAGATIAVLALVVAMPRLIDTVRDLQHDQVGGTPTPSSTEALAPIIGRTFGATVADEGSVVKANSLGGRWVIELRADGTMSVSAPPSFTAGRNGYSYRITGELFRTDLFSSGVCSGIAPGVYRWIVSGSDLTLIPIDDACEARSTLIASQPWRTIQP
jgi:hypothetical protein